LFDQWHREAVENILRTLDDPQPFSFKQGFELCLALDFLDDLDDTLRDQLYTRILLPVGEKFMRELRGGSNHQTTRNLSLLCIGLLTGRQDFIERVTSDPERSYLYQLANSVDADGFWYEQSHVSYHSGSIERLLRLRWILRRNGLDQGGDDVICRMLDTFPGMAMQGGVLPLIGEVSGDSRPTIFRGWFELAYAMYETPWIGWALGRMPREDLWSVLVGRDIGAAEPPEPRSQLFPATGLCVLKTGERDIYWDGQGSGATITFGPHGDWHGHAGKLGIEYRYNDRYLLRDLGHGGGYSHPTHRLWYMTTLAHNTVVLDGRNQSFTWCHDRPELQRLETGVCHANLFRDDVSACTVSADFAYPGCRLQRTLFLTGSYLLDIMECNSLDETEHTFDWVLHTGGRLQSDLPFTRGLIEPVAEVPAPPTPPDKVYSCGDAMPLAYDYIREVEVLQTSDRWSVDAMDAKWAADYWKIGDKAMQLTMLGEADTTVYKGVCPTAVNGVYDPVIIARRRGHKTTFIALHVPGERKLNLELLQHENGTIVCRVSEDGVTSDILVKQDTTETIKIEGKTISEQLEFFTQR